MRAKAAGTLGEFHSDSISPTRPVHFSVTGPRRGHPIASWRDDERARMRVSYSVPSATVRLRTVSGRVLPAILFAVAGIPSPSTGRSETGIFGAQVVAVDANTSRVIAGTLGRCDCNAASPPASFDGTYELDCLPVAHNYISYAEPLEGIVSPSDFG
jgi:hypothetical protein